MAVNQTLKTSSGSNVLTVDPDRNIRRPFTTGGTHICLSGRRVYDLLGIHYAFALEFEYMDATLYEALRELYYSGEILYFDDGNVPPLVETATVYAGETLNFIDVTKPSGTHIGYINEDVSATMPLTKGVLEAAEIETADYTSIGAVAGQKAWTTDPSGLNTYTVLKCNFLVSTPRDNVRSLSITATITATTPASRFPGSVVRAWLRDTVWNFVAVNPYNGQQVLTYDTIDSAIAKSFIDPSDNYIRLLLANHGWTEAVGALELQVSFVQVTINGGSNLAITLTHTPILSDGDVIWVKNLTRDTTLWLTADYTISGRVIDVDWVGVHAVLGNDKYFLTGNVLNGGTDDICISVWFKPVSTGIQIIASTQAASGVGYSLMVNRVGLGDPFLQFEMYDGVDTFYLWGASAPETGDLAAFIRVDVIIDRSDISQCKIFLDGVDDTEDSSGAAVLASIGNVDSPGGFAVGGYNDDTSYGDIEINDVRVYIASGAHWTDAEAVFHYTNPRDFSSPGGSYSSYWSFDDDADATNADGDGMITDGSGSGNHLDAQGGNTSTYGDHSRTITAEDSDEIEVKYNRYFEVKFDNIPEDWLSGDPASARNRSAVVNLSTLTGGVVDS